MKKLEGYFSALPEDVGLAASTYIKWLKITCNSTSREIQCPWSLWTPVHMCLASVGTYAQIHTHTHN